MFTGLVEEIGTVRNIVSTELGVKVSIGCMHVLKETKTGDSIAVNGVCLTAISVEEDFFEAEVMRETLNKTTISTWDKGVKVNLERALLVGQRLGGHLVQGHVDGIAILVKRTKIGNSELFQFEVEKSLTDWMIGKGSIAVDGISLTIVDVGNDSFTVSLIPHTLENTHLRCARLNEKVNIECDMVGKYLAKWALKKKVTYA